jgi:enoyl-CoA hydratase/carnithine racemase
VTVRVHGHLIEERSGAVATLRVDREEALGALSRSMVVALRDYFLALRDDPTVRVLVLTGTGRGFVAGADIAEYHQVSRVSFNAYQQLSREMFDTLEALPQFTVAGVNGYALGGGFELALCCDVIIASDKARVGLPEVKLGLIPGGGGTQRLSRALGSRRTKLLLATGAIVPADSFLAGGVVARVVPAAALQDEVRDLAREIAAGAPCAVAAAKQVVNVGLQMSMSEALTLEQDMLSALFATTDATEGISAFLAKRKPVWQGR